jgi:hypothetical protein
VSDVPEVSSLFYVPLTTEECLFFGCKLSVSATEKEGGKKRNEKENGEGRKEGEK